MTTRAATCKYQICFLITFYVQLGKFNKTDDLVLAMIEFLFTCHIFKLVVLFKIARYKFYLTCSSESNYSNWCNWVECKTVHLLD